MFLKVDLLPIMLLSILLSSCASGGSERVCIFFGMWSTCSAYLYGVMYIISSMVFCLNGTFLSWWARGYLGDLGLLWIIGSPARPHLLVATKGEWKVFRK